MSRVLSVPPSLQGCFSHCCRIKWHISRKVRDGVLRYGPFLFHCSPPFDNGLWTANTQNNSLQSRITRLALEELMLKIDAEAEEHLANLLTGEDEHAAIRIAVMGGAQGAGFGLVIDEAGGDDLKIAHKNLSFIIDKKLMAYCKSIRIGFRKGNEGGCGGSSGSGFLISSEIPLSF